MIGELDIGTVEIIFDPLIKESFFKQDSRFVQNYELVTKQCSELSDFIVCIGNYAGWARVETSKLLRQIGLNPLSMVHHTAWVDSTTSMGVGLQIMPRATVQKFTSVGDWSIINTGAVVDHECQIGVGAHIMGGAAIAGRVTVGNYATIGTNATILPDIRVGEGAVVGAGAVVTSDVEPYNVVVGMPAKFLRHEKRQDPSHTLNMFRKCWARSQTGHQF